MALYSVKTYLMVLFINLALYQRVYDLVCKAKARDIDSEWEPLHESLWFTLHIEPLKPLLRYFNIHWFEDKVKDEDEKKKDKNE